MQPGGALLHWDTGMKLDGVHGRRRQLPWAGEVGRLRHDRSTDVARTLVGPDSNVEETAGY